MEELIIFTGMFGNTWKNLHPSPNGYEKISFVFSNNRELELTAKTRGWNFVFVDTPIEDYATSSLQSKKLKFLQLLDMPQFKNKQSGIYFDHKFEVKAHHIVKLINLKNPGLIIRETPTYKDSVYDELNESLKQKRYKDRKAATQNWINNILTNKIYSPKNRVCNTGLMIYKLREQDIINLCNEVYDATQKTKNPCCQIFFTILSQKYKEKIKSISFDKIPINWKNPG